VTDETFEEAGERLARNLAQDKRSKASRYLFDLLVRCESYGGVHPDGPYDGEINTQSDVEVMAERRAQIPPGCPMWPRVNQAFSERWAVKWGLAVCEARDAGVVDDLLAFPLRDDVHRAMHPLSRDLLRDRDVGEVAQELARLRERCEETVGNLMPRPDPSLEVRQPQYIGPRYALAAYFRSLRQWLQACLEARGAGDPVSSKTPEPSTPAQVLASPISSSVPVAFDAAALSQSDTGVLLALGLAARRTPPRGLTAGEIKKVARENRLTSFRDDDHVRRTIYSLRDRGWPIENALNGTGYRLTKLLNELCVPLAQMLGQILPIDNQSTTN
jgi:hypothetical protein